MRQAIRAAAALALAAGLATAAAAAGDGGDLVLEGRVGEGAECPILTTPDGETWSLAGEDLRVAPGAYVEIEGRRAGMSFCMQGVGTIDVRSIEEVAPPKGR